MSGLQEIGHIVKNLLFGKGKVLFENLTLFLSFGEVNQNLGLQARVNVFGQLKGGGIVIHGGHQPKIRMSFNLNPSYDRFHIATIIQQRREASPTFFAHAVAFIQNHNPATNHGCHQWRSRVAKLSAGCNHRGDKQVFGPRIQGSL